MTRTRFGLAALAAGGILFAVTAADPQKIPVPVVPQPGPVDPKMPFFVECSKACDDSARACGLCAAHCAKLLADGNKEHLATLKTCQDCAAICSAASCVTSKDGPMSDLICTACAEACKQCGDACEKHAGDPIMKRCMDECRRCEKACRQMIKTAKAGDPPPKK